MDSAGFTQIKFFSQSLQQIFAVTIFADKTVNDLFSIQFDLLQLFLLQTYVMNDGYSKLTEQFHHPFCFFPVEIRIAFKQKIDIGQLRLKHLILTRRNDRSGKDDPQLLTAVCQRHHPLQQAAVTDLENAIVKFPHFTL